MSFIKIHEPTYYKHNINNCIFSSCPPILSQVPYTPDSNTWSSDIDLSAISNTDMGCTSVFDMDCSKNIYHFF